MLRRLCPTITGAAVALLLVSTGTAVAGRGPGDRGSAPPEAAAAATEWASTAGSRPPAETWSRPADDRVPGGRATQAPPLGPARAHDGGAGPVVQPAGDVGDAHAADAHVDPAPVVAQVTGAAQEAAAGPPPSSVHDRVEDTAAPPLAALSSPGAGASRTAPAPVAPAAVGAAAMPVASLGPVSGRAAAAGTRVVPDLAVLASLSAGPTLATRGLLEDPGRPSLSVVLVLAGAAALFVVLHRRLHRRDRRRVGGGPSGDVARFR